MMIKFDKTSFCERFRPTEEAFPPVDRIANRA